MIFHLKWNRMMLITQKWGKPIKVLKCEHRFCLICLEACFLSGRNEEESQCPACKINTLKTDISPSSDLQALLSLLKIQNQPPRGFLRKRCFENMQQICRRTPMLKCDFNKVALQLYWNHTSARVFSYKFAAYFQNTFYKNTSGRLLLKIQCNTCSKM